MSKNDQLPRSKEENNEDMEDFHDPMTGEEFIEDDSKRHTKRLSVLCDI